MLIYVIYLFFNTFTVGVIDIRRTLDYALQDVTDKYLLLEEIEKQSVRKALIEERSHFCLFVGYLQPVLVNSLICSSKNFL